MSSWKWFLLSFFGGAIAFWIPDIIIPALKRDEQGYAVTAACPLASLLFYAVVLRLRRPMASGPSTAIFAICGMWVLALPFAMLAQQMRAEQWGLFTWADVGYLFLSSFIPTRVVKFLALEGSILALFLGTLAMAVCHFVFERSRWIVPPSVWAAIRHAKH